jgi:hypothetical protein
MRTKSLDARREESSSFRKTGGNLALERQRKSGDKGYCFCKKKVEIRETYCVYGECLSTNGNNADRFFVLVRLVEEVGICPGRHYSTHCFLHGFAGSTLVTLIATFVSDEKLVRICVEINEVVNGLTEFARS